MKNKQVLLDYNHKLNYLATHKYKFIPQKMKIIK